MTGEELKQRRLAMGLTREALAALLPLNLRTLQDQEQGANPVHPLMDRAMKHLESECAAFGAAVGPMLDKKRK